MVIKFLLINLLYEESNISSYNTLIGADFIELTFDIENKKINEMIRYSYIIDDYIINDNISRKQVSIKEFLYLYKGLTNSAKLLIINNHVKTITTLKSLYEVYKVTYLLVKNTKILDIRGLYKHLGTRNKDKILTPSLFTVLRHLNIEDEKDTIVNILNITLLTLIKKENEILNYINGTLRI